MGSILKLNIFILFLRKNKKLLRRLVRQMSSVNELTKFNYNTKSSDKKTIT